MNHVYSQGILLNDDIGLDWVFKNSIIVDVVMVGSRSLLSPVLLNSRKASATTHSKRILINDIVL